MPCVAIWTYKRSTRLTWIVTAARSQTDFELVWLWTILHYIYNIEPIAVRLDNLARQFFYKISRSTDCINYLMPNKRPIELLNRLRQPNSLPGIICKTNRFYRSFIPYAIQHYQWCFIELLMFLLILSHCIILYVNPAILLPNNKRMYINKSLFVSKLIVLKSIYGRHRGYTFSYYTLLMSYILKKIIGSSVTKVKTIFEAFFWYIVMIIATLNKLRL